MPVELLTHPRPVTATPATENLGAALLARLKSKGTDYLFINVGTDPAPNAETYA